MVYNGINDVRMNCVPDELFEADYTHCAHYRGNERNVKAGSLSLPGVVRDRVDHLIGLGEPDADMLAYGDSIKTPPAFRANLEGIIEAARSKSAKVVLMTFAIWVPANYTKERFLEGKLGYQEGQYGMPAEVWGKKDNVIRTISAQKIEVRDLAGKHDVIFIDQAELMPKDGRRFSDVCHLTEAGLERFVKNMLPGLQNLLSGSATIKPLDHDLLTALIP